MNAARTRIVAVLLVTALATAVAEIVDAGGWWSTYLVLGAGIVIGELLVLQPEGRPTLPLSFAAFVVATRAFDNTEFIVVVVAAEIVALFLRPRRVAIADRGILLALRTLEAAAALAASSATVDALQAASARTSLLLSLAAAAIAPILLADLIYAAEQRRLPPLVAGRGADLALITSGMLMAIGLQGLDGKGEMGLWGPVLFSIPLLAAWYSFDRLDVIRRTYDQTIQALGAAPELGGMAPFGHGQRVARLCIEIGRELDLSRGELEQLRVAALLHHLGAVCLDGTPEHVRDHEWAAVASASATMLSATETLAPVGEIVAGTVRPHRAPSLPTIADPIPERTALAAQILRVASDFDDLSGSERALSAHALQRMYSGPAWRYDGRVLSALEHVLDRRGVALTRV